MPLILILVESGLELIPPEIKDHQSVKQNSKRTGFSNQLLDNALHHSAMKNLEDFEKRGRPDIVHNCLLNALGSPLNKSGNLKVYIHTYQDKIFHINTYTRIPRNYNRFKGLMAKLLREGSITHETIELISSFNGDLISLIKSFKKREVIIFSNTGRLLVKYQDLFEAGSSKNYIIIIGGFQRGKMSQEILNLSKTLYSISDYSLDAWVVVNKVISFYEIIQDIK